jgi:hypothetical protein
MKKRRQASEVARQTGGVVKCLKSSRATPAPPVTETFFSAKKGFATMALPAALNNLIKC